MGLFGPSIKQENRGGRIWFTYTCNRGNCKRRKFENEDKGKVTKEVKAHIKAHDSKAESGAKSIKRLRQFRENRGACPRCHKNPCKMNQPACVRHAAKEMGSSMNINMDDPGEFDDQLRWYRDNMQ